MPNLADDGLTDNPCWPRTLTDDPGFALLTNDPWYIHNPARARGVGSYAHAPPFAVSNGKYRAGYQKRGDEDWGLAAGEGNSTSLEGFWMSLAAAAAAHPRPAQAETTPAGDYRLRQEATPPSAGSGAASSLDQPPKEQGQVFTLG